MKNVSAKEGLLTNIELLAAGLALLVIVVTTFCGVIWRYFFNDPIPWLEEVQLWCFVWVTFLGAAATFKAGHHIAIDVLVDLLPHHIRRYIDWFDYVIVVGVLLFFANQGGQLIMQLQRTERLTYILHIPYAIIYSAMPLGCLLMIISATIRFKAKLHQEVATNA